MKFAPLNIISGYTFLKSGLTIQKIVQSIKIFDYFGAGICDENVLYGVPSFATSLEAIKKKYIVGTKITLDDNKISLYAKNEEGYLTLVKLSSDIQKDQFDINSIINRGLIAILDTHDSKIYNELISENVSEETNRLVASYSHLAEEFYIGVEVSSKEDIENVKKVREWAIDHTYSLVAFPRIRYVKKEDAIVIKIVEAVANDDLIEEKALDGVEYFYKENLYEKLYTPEEIENTIKIVNSSTFNFHQKRGELLHYDNEKDANILLKDKVFNSLKQLNLDNNQTYIDRVNYELDIICSMGYANYFLVVQDYVSFAKNNGILVGPGRGSAAGSLVSYLLNITEIDPIKYNLQFERFLNPARKTMPDIDIDFMDTRRDEVVEYCRNKYGKDRVSNIITFQTILAKQSLRDIGRIYNYPTNHIDKLSKNLTNKDFTLRESYKNLPNFKKLVDEDKYFLEIVSLASKIEGLPRQSGVHAAGVVLNNNPIESALPISLDLSENYITQYEMGYLEEQGFLKMDFLGLRNLSIIHRAVELVNQNHKDANLDEKHLPYDDPKVFELIASGKTMGLFQLESAGMRRAIKTVEPNCFEDIVAVLALFRPGPMKSIKLYADRKKGIEKTTYLSKDLEDTLSSTYGIIVYQEQINAIATKMAGFTPGESDTFRRAISKKKADVLSSLEKSFIEGAKKKGYTYKESKNVYDLISRFADYGFNRSHSVGYAIIACQMGYLKAYYPLEFYAAILETSSSTNDTKFNEYVSEMKSIDIKMVSPDINKSKLNFVIIDNEIVFPLGAIKGINDTFANKIIYEREINGDFKDFHDFVKRMYAYDIKESQILKLIDSGCFDKMHNSRATLRASILVELQFANLSYGTDGQLLLDFGMPAPSLNEEDDDPLENLDREYQALGIMLSSNPLQYKKDILVAKQIMPIIEAIEEDKIKVAGIIKSKKVINTKKGSPMAFITIFDETAEMEITIFSDLYQEKLSLIKKNNIIIIEGRKSYKNDEISFIADSIFDLEE